MVPYVWKRRADVSWQLFLATTRAEQGADPLLLRALQGVNLINVGKTWEKIVFAARIIGE